MTKTELFDEALDAIYYSRDQVIEMSKEERVYYFPIFIRKLRDFYQCLDSDKYTKKELFRIMLSLSQNEYNIKLPLVEDFLKVHFSKELASQCA